MVRTWRMCCAPYSSYVLKHLQRWCSRTAHLPRCYQQLCAESSCSNGAHVLHVLLAAVLNY